LYELFCYHFILSSQDLSLSSGLGSDAKWSATIVIHHVHGGPKNVPLYLSIFSPVIDRFSKFFQRHTLQTIYNNVIITYPTTP